MASLLMKYIRKMFENIDAHRGGEGGRGAPHVPPIKIFENLHIKM
jgi:hypothetical protein